MEAGRGVSGRKSGEPLRLALGQVGRPALLTSQVEGSSEGGSLEKNNGSLRYREWAQR